MGGSCNPMVVEALQRKFGKERVHTLDRLHVKVWIIDEKIIAGSSNASTNGFGAEGMDAISLFEANLLVADTKTNRQAQKWFAKIWRRSREFTKQDIAQAAERWTKNKNRVALGRVVN